jgi:hypothetical protein
MQPDEILASAKSSHSHSSDWSEDFAVKISMAPIEGVASEDMTWEGILRTIMCFG